MSESCRDTLANLADIRISNVDKKTVHGEMSVQLCNYMDVYTHDYIRNGLDFMQASASPGEIERYGLRRGDVLLTKDSETPDDIGIAAVVADEIPGLVCGYHLALLRPRTERVDPVYLAKQLGSEEIVRRFARLATGSTRYGLSYTAISEAEMRVPELGVQKRISEILSTMDEAIEQTEKLIEKHQQIKAGLMHDLFTRGLTADGRLRPPHREAPQLYKDSPLGPIPNEWETRQLRQVSLSISDGPFGSNLKTEHYVPEPGVRVVRLQNIGEGFYDDSDRTYVDESHACELIRHQVLPGDVLVAGLGEDRHPTGRACSYPEGIGPAINKADCFRLRANPALSSNDFIMNYLNSAHARWQVRRLEQGVTRRRCNASALAEVKVLLPDAPEQSKIVEAIRRASQASDSAEKTRAQLVRIRRGLMHDLLAGVVEVPMPEEELA